MDSAAARTFGEPIRDLASREDPARFVRDAPYPGFRPVSAIRDVTAVATSVPGIPP